MEEIEELMAGDKVEIIMCVDNLVEKLCFEVKQRKRGEKLRASGVKERRFLHMGDSSTYLCVGGNGL